MDSLQLACIFLSFVQVITSKMPPRDVQIHKESYADIYLPEKGNVTIDKFVLKNGFMFVEIITYGSTITSIKFPDRNGTLSDIVLGFDGIDGYLGSLNPYFGATIGRVANRISNGSFRINNETYQISKNIGAHTLHGGIKGFDKKVWDAYIDSNSVVMSYKSEDLEEGFPGNLFVEARYTLTSDNQLVINYKGTCDKPTPINIVNHSYFNLAGAEAVSRGLFQHVVQINADKFTPLTKELIPTGEVKTVDSTYFDLRNLSNLGDKISQTPEGEGYDINYVVRGAGFRSVANLYHPQTGRFMEVMSDQPGVQFYTSNSISHIPGRDGVVYGKHSALCFETQNYPDAVNHQESFPKVIWTSGELYQHTVSFKFGAKPLDELIKN